MRWPERQRAMLARMGIRLWAPPGDGPPAAAIGTDAAADDAVARLPPPRRVVAVAEQAAAVMAATTAATAATAAPVALPAAPPPADARSRAIATLDWPALREAVASCRACGLCQGRTQTVFGVGHPRARWMLVGEAPGEHEDLQGEPFVGRAGQLLDAMLTALGLTRAEGGAAQRQVFIANTLKCRPPRNRNPGPEELAACRPFLERQIELVQPALLLALGRFAVQALLGSDEPVGRLRGRVHRWRGIPLVVSYHPSYLLRSPADKARAWDDLCLAAETAETAIAAAAASAQPATLAAPP